MRRLIAFACEGAALVGTLDDAEGATGLLIVSGGDEVRAGAHRGMALLAARLAGDGVPVFRYDRRGAGDSEGDNPGQLGAAPDLRAAVAAFRHAAPGVGRIVAFGNCDAATLLALEGRAAGIDSVVLANPWTIEQADALPPAAAIRQRYRERLTRPSEWRRLLRGGVDMRRLLMGLRKAATPTRASPLAQRVEAAIASWGEAATLVLAEGDATAIAFAAAVRRGTTRTITIPTSSHSFARAADAVALEQIIRGVL